MSMKIWDNTAKAFKEVEHIKEYNGTVWTDCKAVLGCKSNVWEDKWKPTPKYNFGDGSLNTVSGGYNGKLYISDISTGKDTLITSSSTWGHSEYIKGNGNLTYDLWEGGTQLHTSYNSSHEKAVVYSGTNTYGCSAVTGDGTFSIDVFVTYGSYSFTATIGTFMIRLDGTLYSLKDAVANKKIEPLVIIQSTAQSTSYIFDTPLGLYSNSSTAYGNFANLLVWFIPKQNVVFNGVRLYSSRQTDTSYNDGLGIYKRQNVIPNIGRL